MARRIYRETTPGPAHTANPKCAAVVAGGDRCPTAGGRGPRYCNATVVPARHSARLDSDSVQTKRLSPPFGLREPVTSARCLAARDAVENSRSSEFPKVRLNTSLSKRRAPSRAATATSAGPHLWRFLLRAPVCSNLLTNPPGPRLSAVSARSPEAWVQRYAHVLHRHLRLITLVQYANGTAAVQVSNGNGRLQITLRKDGVLWRRVEG